MPRLSHAQQEARQQIDSLAASGLHPQQLASKLLEALHRAVPSDGGGLVGLDPTTLLHNRLLAAVPSSPPLVSGYYRNVYLSDPVPELLPPALMRAGLPVVVVHRRLERSLGLPKALLRAVSEVEEYRAFYAVQPQPGGSLRAAFAADGQWIAQLELIRRDHNRPFRAGDVEFVRRMTPAIGHALRAAFRQGTRREFWCGGSRPRGTRGDGAGAERARAASHPGGRHVARFATPVGGGQREILAGSSVRGGGRATRRV